MKKKTSVVNTKTCNIHTYLHLIAINSNTVCVYNIDMKVKVNFLKGLT